MWLIIALIIDNFFMLIAFISAALLIPDLGEWGSTSMGIPYRLIVFSIIVGVCIIGQKIQEKKQEDEE